MIASDGMDVPPWVVSVVAIDQDMVGLLGDAACGHVVFQKLSRRDHESGDLAGPRLIEQRRDEALARPI